MPVLNYKFRLYPTDVQARHLDHAMFFVWKGWNNLIRHTERARRHIRLGRRTLIASRTAKIVRGREMSGRRVSVFRELLATHGSPEKALQALVARDVQRIFSEKKNVLAKDYAETRVDDLRKRMTDSFLGGAWAKAVGEHDAAWQAHWSRPKERGIPTSHSHRDARWIALQVQGDTQNLIKKNPGSRPRDRWVALTSLFPRRLQNRAISAMPHVKAMKPGARKAEILRLRQEFTALTNVRFKMHRPLPPGSVIKDLKITRDTIRRGAEWHVVFAVDVPVEAYTKVYPTTGLACGLDPGQKTPLTLWGEDMVTPGIDGEELGPRRPLHKAQNKVAKLQRKLDRQRRANNPHCFSKKGEWLRGKRLTVISKNMRDTEAGLRRALQSVTRKREAVWQLTAKDLLNRYDTVYLGNWTDGSPKAKRAAKTKRRKAWDKDKTQRAPGEAQRSRTANRVNRDNALGRFRQLLVEKAIRAGNKAVILVNEAGTTRNCVACGETNPALASGPASLGIRRWVCPACGRDQDRDRGAAYKIMVKGQQDPTACSDLLNPTPKKSKSERTGKAVAQAVKGGLAPVAQMPVKGKGGSPSGLGRKSLTSVGVTGPTLRGRASVALCEAQAAGVTGCGVQREGQAPGKPGSALTHETSGFGLGA